MPYCYNCLNDVWWRITLFTDQLTIHGKKIFKNKLHKNIPIFSNTQQQNLKSQTRNPAVDHWTTQQLLPNTFSLEQWWEDFSSPIRYDTILYSSYNFQHWGFTSLIVFLRYDLFCYQKLFYEESRVIENCITCYTTIYLYSKIYV